MGTLASSGGNTGSGVMWLHMRKMQRSEVSTHSGLQGLGRGTEEAKHDFLFPQDRLGGCTILKTIHTRITQNV